MASDALDGRVRAPSCWCWARAPVRPSATTWSTPGPRAVDVRFATQPAPLGTVNAVLCASDYVGDAPYGVGNADDVYGRDGCALLAEHLRAAGDTNALVGYRLADAVIGFSPVTRGICQVGDDGRLLGVDERRQVTATPEGGFVAGDGREPATLSPRRPGLHEPVGLHAGLPQDAPGRHGRRRRRLRGVGGPAARGGGPVARHQPVRRAGGRRAAASG